MTPTPWSYTALDTFKNCPRMYHAKYVAKSVIEPKTEAMVYGERVHKHFEDRQSSGVVLPPELEKHEPFMAQLDAKPGVLFTEMKSGITTKMQPCHFFDRDVWVRVIKDWEKLDGKTSTIIDYKTGKPHQKVEQLALFALHSFVLNSQVELVNAQYYWTMTASTSKKVWGRADIPDLWKLFIPHLKQYAEAYQTDIWQPRQSGLCNGWCPVRECEFWRPKLERRER